MKIEKDEVIFFQNYMIACLEKQKTIETLLISRREFTKLVDNEINISFKYKTNKSEDIMKLHYNKLNKQNLEIYLRRNDTKIIWEKFETPPDGYKSKLEQMGNILCF